MPAFEYRQAEEVRDALYRHGVKYLFIGKSGAILLGFPDTTQNGQALVAALRDIGFALTAEQASEITHGKALIQIRNGPFELDLVFAPDGIERFEDAFSRHVDVEGFPVCHIDDIIASRESLPRLKAFREYWIKKR